MDQDAIKAHWEVRFTDVATKGFFDEKSQPNSSPNVDVVVIPTKVSFNLNMNATCMMPP